MKKALIITTVSGFVPQFELNNVKLLQSMGYEVHYASNYHTPVYTKNNDRLKGTGIISHQIDFVRSPFHFFSNAIAYQQLITLMRRISFDLVHCHTPMGGVLGRLAAKKTNTKPIIYTAHGFHFYKGAPLWNWLFFYPVERWLAKYTDCIILINREDYIAAKKFPLRCGGKIYYLSGVGIPMTEIRKRNKQPEEIRKSFNIPAHKKVIVSVGELSKRKNHQIAIRALYNRKKDDYIYLICGSGKQEQSLRKLIHKLKMEHMVRLLGYQTDIYDILSCADLFLFPSLQEGLPVALMEAIVCEVPIVCSNIRGNSDLVTNSMIGHCVKKNSVADYTAAITRVLENVQAPSDKLSKKTNINLLKYDSSQIIKKMKQIYLSIKQ